MAKRALSEWLAILTQLQAQATSQRRDHKSWQHGFRNTPTSASTDRWQIRTLAELLLRLNTRFFVIMRGLVQEELCPEIDACNRQTNYALFS